ncbi:MAG: hypothetical protein MK188_12485 [Gammaproteobacteria bacterium]|nr:hypothetical protein [Gammaproteobacteria bacterium]
MRKNLHVPARFSMSLLLVLAASQATANTFSWDGSIELEQRYFFDTQSDSFNNERGQTSAKLELEVFRDWNEGKDTFVLEPMVRVDSQDDERSHADLRQFIWSHLEDDWELSAGLGRVFWGVTESQHLVDVVNQTDLVENIDGEDKLGQPMVRFQYFHDLGTIDAYILPLFRPRTFPSIKSRLSSDLGVAANNEVYESSQADNHIDFALRYSQTLGVFDLGFSIFDGTSRDPDLFRLLDPASATTTPFYPQITQYGADIQVTTGAWLLKFEGVERDFDDSFYDDYSAITLGAEYTLVGLLGSTYDLGMLAEYSRDDRGELATAPFQNDLFLGARLALNDINSSEVLFGLVRDLDDSKSNSVFLEGSTRIADSVTANIELRYFESVNPSDVLYGFRDDSFIQLGLQYFFD